MAASSPIHSSSTPPRSAFAAAAADGRGGGVVACLSGGGGDVRGAPAPESPAPEIAARAACKNNNKSKTWKVCVQDTKNGVDSPAAVQSRGEQVYSYHAHEHGVYERAPAYQGRKQVAILSSSKGLAG